MGSTLQPVYPTGVPVSFAAPAMDSVPPRPVYFVLLPAVLTVGGVLSWIISGDLGLLLGCVIATIIGLFTLWEWLFRHAPTRISTLLAMSLLLGYGAGALNTWLTLPRGNLTVGQFMGLGAGVLARGIAAVLLSATILYFLGESFEKPLFGPGFKLEIDSTIRRLIYWGAVGMILGYASHRLVIGGSAAASGGHASIPGMFLSWLFAPLAALAVSAFLTARSTRHRLFSGLSALVYLLLLAVSGRRNTVYTTVEIFFVLALAGYRWRGKGVRTAVLILFFGAVIVLSSLAFMLLRIAPVYDTGGTATPTTMQKVAAADRLVQQGNALAMAAAATRKNVETRTLVLTFLANVLDASSRKTPGLGHDALTLIEGAIPSVIDPNKNRWFSEEGFADQLFGFGYGDQANSVLTAGATDFGLLGVILYPIGLVIIARITLAFISAWLKPIPVLLVTLAMVNLFLQTEVGLTGYFADLRNDIIFGIVIQIFISLPRIRFGFQQMETRV